MFGVSGASAGVLALFGVYAVRNPFKLGFADFMPMPALASIVVLLLVKLVFSGFLDMLPLLSLGHRRDYVPCR